MIDCSKFFNTLKSHYISFYAGVPDSLLKDFCAYVSDHASKQDHIITANEGGAIALAAGYFLATGNIPLVYMQNSGLGNAINPLLSLADKEVYSIPMILMIGWRGEPGVKDEPQHIKQGRIQKDLLEVLEIPYKILDSSVCDVDTFLSEVVTQVKNLQSPVAIVVKKGAFSPYKLEGNQDRNLSLTREQAVQQILSSLPKDAIVISTTGKTSREVFEYREHKKEGHNCDFLTVGSMGHCSQIALGIALNTKKLVLCLDGDGAAIMHMGSMAIIGTTAPSNLIHIVLNNGSHDSVGGQPTLGFKISFITIARACGYKKAITVNREKDLKKVMQSVLKAKGPVLVEVKVSKGARKDLGRPTSTPIENKLLLMNKIKK